MSVLKDADMIEETQRLRKKLAEYSIIVDMLTDLPKSHTQEQAVNKLFGLTTELCVPACIAFIPERNEKFMTPKVSSPTDQYSEIIEELTQKLGGSSGWVSVDDSFAVSVNVGEKRYGILFALGVVSPEHISEYAEILETTAGPLALVMANSQYHLELEESENNYRLLAENATDIVWKLDKDSTMVWVSASLESVLGWKPEELLGTKPRALTHPDDDIMLSEKRKLLFAGEPLPESELRMRNKKGDYIWMSVQVRPTFDESGEVDGVVVGLRNVNTQVLSREALERSENLFRVAMEGAPQGMAVIDLDLKFLQVNKALANMLGYSVEWLLAHKLEDVVETTDLENNLNENYELISGDTKSIVRESRWIKADGTILWVLHSTGLLRDERNKPLFHVSHIHDNTEAHERNAQLNYRATHDSLTGLVNREKLQERIDATLSLKPRRQGVTGLLFCDIDNFKKINDTFGHAIGDEVLQTVGARMVSILRTNDTVARIGGDEFVIVLSQVYDVEAAKFVAEKIHNSIREPIMTTDNISINISIGIALADENNNDANKLLRNADRAMYKAKDAGRDQVCVFIDETITSISAEEKHFKEKTQKLEESQYWYNTLWDMSTDMLATVSMEGNFLTVSPSWKNILGYDDRELVGHPYLDFIHFEDREKIREKISTIAETHEDMTSFAHRYRTKDGKYLWCVLNISTSSDGLQTVYIVRNINELINTINKLRESERLYRLLAENVTDTIFLVSLSGVVEWVSPSVKDTLGFTQKELLNTDATELVHPDDLDDLRSVRKAVVDGNTYTVFELRMRTNTGEYIWVSGNTGPTYDADNVLVGRITTVRNVNNEVLARKKLERSEETFRQALNSAHQGMALIDLDGKFLQANEALLSMIGMPWIKLKECAEDELFVKEDNISHSETYQELIVGKKSGDVHEGVLYNSKNEKIRIIHSLSLVRDKNENPIYFVSQYQNVEELYETRELAQISENRYRILAENATDIVWQLDADERIVWVSASVEAILGWNPDKLLGVKVTNLIHPDDVDSTQQWKKNLIKNKKVVNLKSRRKTVNGDYRWMFLQGRPTYDEQGVFTGFIVGMRDIEEEVQSKLALAHALEHDPLTGLATLSVALLRIDRILNDVTMKSRKSHVGVLCIGVDSIKTVNETFTHSVGDRILLAVASKIAKVSNNTDLIARGSGDEFIVILPELFDETDANIVAEKIRIAVQETLLIDNNYFEPTVSIGIAVGNGKKTSGEKLLSEATLAMHKAKSNGRNRSEFFSVELEKNVKKYLNIEHEIREGLKSNQFVPWLQPIVDLNKGTPVGYEALIRWVKPNGEIVPPGDFLPTAERTALIAELDFSILSQCVDMLTTLPEPLYIAVNVSAQTLRQKDYAQTVIDIISKVGVNPSRLHLELTETAIFSASENIREEMLKLSDMGMHWYVDDFGTGYSSISHLRDLPISGLKLDLSFTAGLETGDPTCVHLAQALSGLASGLNLDTVAEGIETTKQSDILSAQNWKHGQGWHYGRPVPYKNIT